MKIVADLHTHTLVSNHAFNTLTEMVAQAKKIGLKAIAITDHACTIPDAPHPWYFYNLMTLPDVIDGIVVLKGAEANVLSAEGELDIPLSNKPLDWVIASIHGDCFKPQSTEDVTNAWLSIAKNKNVDMIGHCEQEKYRFDYDRVIKAFAENNKIVEMNANSVNIRPGNEDNLRQIALLCKKYGAQIAVNSDAHSIYSLGQIDSVTAMLKEIAFPKELIANAYVTNLKAVLKQHNKMIYSNL